MRSTLVKLHRWLGLACGLVFFLVCVSGSILVFEDELTVALNRNLLPQTEKTVSIQRVKDSASDQLAPGEWIQRIYLPLGRVRVRGPQGTRHLYFSPADGRFLGVGNDFMSSVIKFHRNLLLSNPGRWITLFSCLFVMLTVLSGLKLWMPKKWKNLKGALSVKKDGSKRRFYLDLHRVVGVLVSLPILLIGITGLNYSKVSDLYRQGLFSLFNEQAIPEPKPVLASADEPLELDVLVAIGQAVYPEALLSCVELTNDPEKAVKIRFLHSGQPGDFGQSNVMLHPRTGEVLRALNAMEMGPAHQFVYLWALPLHRGELLGFPLKIVWTLLVLAAGSLPLTGLWLWYSRRGRKRQGDEPA